MKLYTLDACHKLMAHYTDKGGFIEILDDGALGLGLLVLSCEGLKYAIIREVYLNSQSSAHSVRFYNKLPKKYTR